MNLSSFLLQGPGYFCESLIQMAIRYLDDVGNAEPGY